MARGILAQIGVEGQETMASESKNEAASERFEDILGRLRGLVERLEGGNLPLEESLRAFEEGMELCRRGTVILDGAEKKVETLLAQGRTTPFEVEGGKVDER
jgi:exodeoxyribonuclease VII small subunit